MAEHEIALDHPLKFLTVDEISMIDRFLTQQKGGGEACLLVQNGRLRFLTWTHDIDLNSEEVGPTQPTMRV